MTSVHVDLQANLVHITPSPTVALQLEEVPPAIRSAGFVPGEIVVEARGVFEGDRFRIRGWSEVLSVKAPGPPPVGEVSLRARVDYSAIPVVLEPIP